MFKNFCCCNAAESDLYDGKSKNKIAVIFFPQFPWLYLYQMLDNVASCHCMQFQKKRIIQTQENDKKPHSAPDLGMLIPNLGCQFFLEKCGFASHWI